MKFTRWIGLVMVILILLGVFSIWIRARHTPTQAEAQPLTDSGKPGGSKRPNEDPAPVITLSVNCLRDGLSQEGSPLLIEAAVTADHIDDETIPFVLSKPGGRWGDFASIEIRNAAGRTVSGLNIRAASPTPASISINGNSSGWLSWVVQPAGGKLLPAGDYSVRAILDFSSSSDPGSWRGTTRSSASRLTVKSSSEALSEAEARFKALVEIRTHGALTEGDAALDVADKYLAQHPKDSVILEEKGDVLASAKKLQEALVAYNAALDNTPLQPESPYGEPPELLLLKRSMTERALQDASKLQ